MDYVDDAARCKVGSVQGDARHCGRVEFAIVAPLICCLVSGFDLGRVSDFLGGLFLGGLLHSARRPPVTTEYKRPSTMADGPYPVTTRRAKSSPSMQRQQDGFGRSSPTSPRSGGGAPASNNERR